MLLLGNVLCVFLVGLCRNRFGCVMGLRICRRLRVRMVLVLRCGRVLCVSRCLWNVVCRILLRLRIVGLSRKLVSSISCRLRTPILIRMGVIGLMRTGRKRPLGFGIRLRIVVVLRNKSRFGYEKGFCSWGFRAVARW